MVCQHRKRDKLLFASNVGHVGFAVSSRWHLFSQVETFALTCSSRSSMSCLCDRKGTWNSVRLLLLRTDKFSVPFPLIKIEDSIGLALLLRVIGRDNLQDPLNQSDGKPIVICRGFKWYLEKLWVSPTFYSISNSRNLESLFHGSQVLIFLPDLCQRMAGLAQSCRRERRKSW